MLDRVTVELIQEAHAEQAFVESAGPRDQRAHVVLHDRADGHLVELVGAAKAGPLAVTTSTLKSRPDELMPTLAASSARRTTVEAPVSKISDTGLSLIFAATRYSPPSRRRTLTSPPRPTVGSLGANSPITRPAMSESS